MFLGAVNIPAILIANAMGLTILFVVIVGNYWRFKDKKMENKYLFIIFIACILNCITDPACFLADGKPGFINKVLVIGCNSLLYLGGIVIAYYWIYLVTSHIGVKLDKIHITIIETVFMIVVLAIIVNLFVPILFTTNSYNEYFRLSGYYFYIVSYIGFMLDGLVLYLIKRHKSGELKFFPVWAFVIPATIGTTVQTIYYGISTATPFVTVSLICIILCLQNEFMVRDKLTGLYNRFYLNSIESVLAKSKNKYSMIMLDINNFKGINDNFGHNIGDEALILLSNVLINIVDQYGVIVRYAGDEFIVILNTQEEERIESIINSFNSTLDVYNKEKKIPYELTLSYGYMNLDFKEKNMNEFIDIIDKLMYKNKQEYYKTHERCDRRKKYDIVQE